MNSGCVEVVDARVGAAPYLIRHGENGLLYPNGSYDEMEKLVFDLFENWQERRYMGRAAYETIRDLWNAEYAAAALLRFTDRLRQGRIVPEEEGPLSVAPIIKPR